MTTVMFAFAVVFMTVMFAFAVMFMTVMFAFAVVFMTAAFTVTAMSVVMNVSVFDFLLRSLAQRDHLYFKIKVFACHIMVEVNFHSIVKYL